MGVPDNWRDFYPTEGHGRGDAWIGPKMDLITDREVANPGGPHTFLSVADRRRAEKDPAFAKLHPEALTGNPKDRTTQPQWAPPRPKDRGSQADREWLHKYGIWSGTPEQSWSMSNRSGSGLYGPPFDPKNPPPGMTVQKWWEQNPSGLMPGPHGQMIPASQEFSQGDTYSNSGRSPGPPPRAGTPIHQPGQPPPAGYGRAGQQAPSGTAAAAQPPATNEQLGKWFATMKPGATMEIRGKKYFKNQNGAVVDVTNPAARKRITDRQGAFVGQAAAPPPGAPAAAPPTPRQPIGAQPPPTTPGGPIQRPVDQPPPTMPINPSQAEYPPTNQPPYQYDPYSMNQFAYPQGQGPGPYGWNPGYGGPPFNYSNFSNAIMQGMGGGGGYGMPQMTGNEMSYYGGGMMPQMQNFMQSMMGGMGGGYGWPEHGYGGGLNSLPPQVQGLPGLQMNPYAQGDYGMSGGDMRGGIDFGSNPYGGIGIDPNMMMMGYY